MKAASLLSSAFAAPRREGFAAAISEDGSKYVIVLPDPLSLSVSRISTGTNKPAVTSWRSMVIAISWVAKQPTQHTTSDAESADPAVVKLREQHEPALTDKTRFHFTRERGLAVAFLRQRP
jgi:hypothetical protein